MKSIQLQTMFIFDDTHLFMSKAEQKYNYNVKKKIVLNPLATFLYVLNHLLLYEAAVV